VPRPKPSSSSIEKIKKIDIPAVSTSPPVKKYAIMSLCKNKERKIFI